MTYKKFIPCIYLYKGNAVKGFTDGTIIDTNPAALAKFYGDNNADELIVYDMSDSDLEHEEALDIIKSICSEAEVPVIGAGNVKRMEDIKKLAAEKSSVVIAVSEGVKIADGRYVCELGREVAVDAFGHKQMSGTAVMLANKVAEETGLKTRAIEFSTLQRAATHLASLTDINEAFQVGFDAVKAAEEGKTGMMITLDRNGEEPYQCGTSAYDIHAIANVERKVPDEWITEDCKGLNDGYEKYARPLIMGELQPLYVNGLPRHLVRKG